MASVAPDTGAGASDLLLERAAELALLDDSLRAVERGGGGRVVLVGGEAGVGKTTLVRRFLADHAAGVRVLAGACDPRFAPRPLGPLLAVAERCGGELQATVERQALPYEVASGLVRELARHPATVFVLEDAHWADEATLDVVRLLV